MASTSTSTSTSSTPRLLRLTISVYRNPQITSEQGHDFARNNHAIKAAPMHAAHGITSYIQCFTPLTYRKALEDMNNRRNRGWVVDDHDMTIEFYFRTFEELGRITNDPEFQKLQEEEEPYVNRTHTVVSLGWVEQYVMDGEVVNIKEGRSMYPGFEELNDVAAGAGNRGESTAAV